MKFGSSPLSWRNMALAVVAASLGASWIRNKFDVAITTANTNLIVEDYDCFHEYTIEILSLDPVMMYLNNFVSDNEVKHLLEVTKEGFNDSFVYLPNGTSVVDKRYRTSKSAMVPKNDTVSRCLQKRVQSLLGNVQHEDTERLQLVKYAEGEKFVLHNDWLENVLYTKATKTKPARAYNRLVSIFVYLEDDCEGGETYFPNIKGVPATADGTKFSRDADDIGLLVKPRKGNAVFWNNIHPNGTGDDRLDHSSLPVESGTKIGMNMFGLYFPDKPIVGV